MRGVWSSSRPMARSRPREGDRFEHLAHQGDEDDLGRHERLADHQCGQARLRQGDVRPDPPVGQGLDRAVDDPDPPQHRRDQRQRDSPGARQASQPRAPKTTSPPIRRPITTVRK